MAKNTYFGAVAAVALLVGAAGGAQAAPYAYGTLGFSNLSLNGVVNSPGVTVNGSTVTTSASATYNGTGTSTSAGGDLASGSDTGQSVAGTGAFPGQNVFTQQLTSASGTRGDANIAGAINAGASANVVSEGRLTTVPGTAASSAGTSTGISVTFTATTATTISLSFTASGTLIATTEAAGEGASAQTNASFTITRSAGGNGTTVFNYAPEELNRSVSSTNGGPAGLAFSPSKAFTTGNIRLDAGTYQLTLTSGVQERLQSAAVPEPASMALLGIGLLGFGLARRRTA